MFFERYPQFYETSQTSASSGRLNLRYEAIFAEHSDLFEGARVLDIASHDGRWSVAALATGAKSVVGIEARPDLVEHARANLATYGYRDDQFRFIAGDVLEVMRTEKIEVDLVLCLGFLYHTLRYNELFHGIASTGAEHLIIDTRAPRMPGRRAAVHLRAERTSREGNAVVDEFSVGSNVLIGQPNLKAVRTMLSAYGYRVERLSDWPALLRDNPGLSGIADYAERKRMTIRCVADATLGEGEANTPA
jgi:hypothetical protein